jgi:hypothetical protein
MRENGDIKHFSERLRDNDVAVYEEPKRNPIGFISQSAQQVKEPIKPIEVKKPLVGMRLREALRNGGDVYGNKPLDSIIYTPGHGEALPVQQSKPSIFTRFSQVLDKHAKTRQACVGTQQACVGTQQYCVGTQTDLASTQTDIAATQSATQSATQVKLYKVFADIPDFGNGFCSYCGCDLKPLGKSANARFCSTVHKDAFWNLKTPSSHSKRVTRQFT